jgi:hypothetical protein
MVNRHAARSAGGGAGILTKSLLTIWSILAAEIQPFAMLSYARIHTLARMFAASGQVPWRAVLRLRRTTLQQRDFAEDQDWSRK